MNIRLVLAVMLLSIMACNSPKATPDKFATSAVKTVNAANATRRAAPKPTATVKEPAKHKDFVWSTVHDFRVRWLEAKTMANDDFGCWRGSPRDEHGVHAWGKINRLSTDVKNTSHPDDPIINEMWRHLVSSIESLNDMSDLWYSSASCSRGVDALDGVYDTMSDYRDASVRSMNEVTRLIQENY